MLAELEKFFNKILDFIFGLKEVNYYVLGIAGVFVLLYAIGFFAACSGKLSAIKKAEKILLKDPATDTAAESIEYMPKEIKQAYSAAKAKGKKNPALALKYDTCVKTPYAFSFVSKFTKYSFFLTVLLSFLTYAFFNLGFSYSGNAEFITALWPALFALAVMGFLGTGLAACIALGRYKKSSKRFVEYSNLLISFSASENETADVQSAQAVQNYASEYYPESVDNISSESAEELIARINTLSKEGASLTTLKEAAYQLQQERVKSENINPIMQRKLNDALNVLIKAMSSAIVRK